MRRALTERSGLRLVDDGPGPHLSRLASRLWATVRLRFYLDRLSGQPHIYGHGVTEAEVEEVLSSPGEDRAGAEGSRIALGQATSGRYLRVVYVLDPEPDSVFVVTAYTLEGKALTAYKRRRARKPGRA